MVLISKRHRVARSRRGIKYSCNYDGIINSRKKLQTVVATRPGRFVISYATPAKVIGRTGIKNELIYTYMYTYIHIPRVTFLLSLLVPPPPLSLPLTLSLFFSIFFLVFHFFDVPGSRCFVSLAFRRPITFAPCKLLAPIRAAIIIPRQKKYYVRDTKVC